MRPIAISCSMRSPDPLKKFETDDINSRMFDFMILRMQIALAEDDMAIFENHPQRPVEIAMLLEGKSTIPSVKVGFE